MSDLFELKLIALVFNEALPRRCLLERDLHILRKQTFGPNFSMAVSSHVVAARDPSAQLQNSRHQLNDRFWPK